MDFAKSKEGFSSRLGRGLGVAFAVCLFLVVFYFVTWKAGVQSIGFATFILCDSVLFVLAAAVAGMVAACRGVNSFSAGDFAGGFRRGFSDFGRGVSDAVNVLLLSFLYFIGVGAVSIVMRASGRKFMDFDFRNKGSYYIQKDVGGGSAEDYLRQF